MGTNDREPLEFKKASIGTVVLIALAVTLVIGGAQVIKRLDTAAYRLRQQSKFRDFGFKAVDVNNITTTSANVEWQTVRAKRVGIDLFYHDPEMTMGWPDWEVVNDGEGVMVFTGLEPNTDYDFEIVAYASDGPDRDERKNKTMVHGKFRTAAPVETEAANDRR